jgi:hypothetical protein
LRRSENLANRAKNMQVRSNAIKTSLSMRIIQRSIDFLRQNSKHV